MLTVSYKTVLEMSKGLESFSKSTFPLRLSAIVRRWLRRVREHKEDFEEEARKLVLRFAKLDEDGKPQLAEGGNVLFPSGEAVGKYLEAERELEAVEVELDVEQIQISDLGNAETFQITPEVLDQLGLLVQDDLEKTPNA